MNVQCQKCGVEYEFDDDRVTEEGVTVKCTSCSHIFKVKREVRVVTEAVTSEELSGDWVVRQAAGARLSFKELTTLQRWIIERKVSRDDEISKTGHTWKKLGDIIELASFFQVVDEATGRTQSQTAMPLTTVADPAQPLLGAGHDPLQTQETPRPEALTPAPVLNLEPAPATTTGSFPQQIQPAPATTTDPGALVAGAEPSPKAEQQQAKPTVDEDDTLLDLKPPVAPATPEEAEALALATAVAEQTDAALASSTGQFFNSFDLEEDDPVLNWQRQKRLPKIILLIVVVLGLGLGGLRFFARPVYDQVIGGLLGTELPPEVKKILDEAMDAIALDVTTETVRAETEVTTSLDSAGAFSQPHAVLAMIHVALAEAAEERVRLSKEIYDALLARSSSAEIEGNSPERAQLLKFKSHGEQAMTEAAERFRRAATHSTEALKIDPKGPLANLAAADLLRATRSSGDIEARLKIAREGLGENHAHVRFVAALAGGIEGETARGALSALLPLAEEDPKNGRARFQVVRLHEILGDLEGAEREARSLHRALPGHDRVMAWLEARKESAGAPDQQPTADEHATAPPAAAGPVAEQPVAAKPQAVAGGTAPDVPATDAPGTYDGLLKKADRLRDRGSVRQALTLYGQAAKLEPTRAEPRAGQGWCYFDLGKSTAAISAFRSALDANPELGEAHLGLAEIYREQGNKAQAVKHYQAYLKILPGGPEANLAKRAIERLQD